MINKNKFIFIFSFLLAITIYLSGCIYTDYSDNYDINSKTNSEKVVDDYLNKLSNCDDNDPCTIEYLDSNYICKYKQDAKCIEARDNNTLKNEFDAKLLNCNNSLKINAINNNCINSNINDKLQCIKELSQKTDNINCCYLITNNFEELKKTETKLLINKCQIDLVINKNDSNNCINTNNPKECFLCYLKNNGLSPYISNICTSFTGDNKQFCNSSILLNYSYCEKIIDPELKKSCLTNEVNQNNCIYYNMNLPQDITKSRDKKTNAFEVYDNTRTKLEYVKRELVDVNDFWQYYKTSQNYKFAFDDTITQSKALDNCKLDLDNPKIDYDKKKYSTFYFDYKDYHFVYVLPVYDDLYLYSKELKYQYCYEFKEKESYKRYLMDPLNNAVLDRITEDFNSLHNYGFSDSEIFEIAVKFVQEIPYNYNWEKKNVYPYEVFYTMKGVCLDKVAILAQLLKNLGYETYIASGIVDYTGSTLNHAVLAVPCNNSSYLYGNKQMCFIETTHPFLIGEKEITNSLDFTKISDGKSYIETNYGPTKAKELKDNEDKMNSTSKQIEYYSNNKDWANYNKSVLEYNQYLYNTLKIKFKTYK